MGDRGGFDLSPPVETGDDTVTDVAASTGEAGLAPAEPHRAQARELSKEGAHGGTMGAPVLLEWAIVEDSICLLPSRPVTTL